VAPVEERSKVNSRHESTAGLEKTPSGIVGLDEITDGGLPRGRPTLVSGPAGSGKTLLAMEFLVRGAVNYNEPGVFVAFEETEDDLTKNVASLGFDLEQLSARKQLLVDHIRIERSEIEETGEYDLEGLFIRLGYAIDSLHARRVVLDTIEVLFAGLANHAIVRAELRRLFRWLKDRGVTAMITAERSVDALSRYGIEEYVADCVIALDHRVTDQISTRRLRVVKYRGSLHGTNEYPFLIGQNGITVLPVTSLGLTHQSSRERVSSGVPRLDTMLGGEGFYRGSSILISGAAGTGKSSLAAAFALESCQRGERCLYFAFEESSDQILRNMQSINLDLASCVKTGLLQFHAARPTARGLESHLAEMHVLIDTFRPLAVVVDPVSNLAQVGSLAEVTSTLARLIDFLKVKQITLLCTNLVDGGDAAGPSELIISSLMDSWLQVRNMESNGERNRGLYVMKSRGMAHSNQVREFVLSEAGIDLLDVYTGGGKVLAGSARLAQLERERSDELVHHQDIEARQRQLERGRIATQAQIAVLRADLESEDAELARLTAAVAAQTEEKLRARTEMALGRMSDNGLHPAKSRP
jgi:circadian clock protein KaiC